MLGKLLAITGCCLLLHGESVYALVSVHETHFNSYLTCNPDSKLPTRRMSVSHRPKILFIRLDPDFALDVDLSILKALGKPEANIPTSVSAVTESRRPMRALINRAT